MPFTTPPTAITGAVVQAQHRNVLRSNDLWFNALVPAPGAANQVPALTSAQAGVWAKLQTASFQTGAVGTAELAAGAITTAKVQDSAIAATDLSSSMALSLAPPGLVLMVRTAAEIPSGWTREDDLDGRHLINAGTTFSVTFGEASDYGSTWSHNHTIPTITTGGPDSTTNDLEALGPASSAATTTHTHTFSGSTDNAAWVIPTRAYIFCRFDP